MTDRAQPKTDTDRSPKEAVQHRHEQKELDRALEDSFPASDPPSITQPIHTEEDKDETSGR